MKVYDASSDELLGELDVEGLTDDEILDELQESDYIESAAACELRHAADSDLYVFENGKRVLNLSPVEFDDEDEEDLDEDEEDEDDET